MQAVAWYLRYPLSYRDLKEMFREHGFEVDHGTINRWVLVYAPMSRDGFVGERCHDKISGCRTANNFQVRPNSSSSKPLCRSRHLRLDIPETTADVSPGNAEPPIFPDLRAVPLYLVTIGGVSNGLFAGTGLPPASLLYAACRPVEHLSAAKSSLQDAGASFVIVGECSALPVIVALLLACGKRDLPQHRVVKG